MKTPRFLALTLALAGAGIAWSVSAQTTLFTYQGRIFDGGNPASGSYDMTFGMYNAGSGGSAFGNTITNLGVAVSNGVFTVNLDFGDIYDGTSRYLAVGVRTNGNGVFTAMPRQYLSATPYAVYASRLRLSDSSMWLRSGSDTNHGLGWYGSGKTFAGLAPDGPVLFGYGGGGLGTEQTGTEKIALRWFSDGSVIMSNAIFGTLAGTTLSANNLTVSGTLSGSTMSLTNLTVLGTLVGNGGGLTNLSAQSVTNAWLLNGNNVQSGQFLGSTNNQPLELWVNNSRAFRLEPTTNGMPNVIGGVTNSVGGGASAATIGGGVLNTIEILAGYATIAGGQQNSIQNNSFNGFLGGGFLNTIQTNCNEATIAGGDRNIIQTGAHHATIGGGQQNAVSAVQGTIPGGMFNAVAGQYGFAAGFHAKANHTGAFVWGDSVASDFTSTANNEFSARATGGVRFVTAVSGTSPTAGVTLAAGGTAWATLSDKNAKKNFAPVDGTAVLDKLAEVPVESWNYRWESDGSTAHIGPMAQDFKHAFYPGSDDKSITTLEFDGVELAAIQGLNHKLEAARQELKQKEDRIQALEQRLEALERRLDAGNVPAGH